MFPLVTAYQDKAERKAHADEAVYPVTGQRRVLPPLLDDQRESGYWPSLEARKRRIVNTPIQGGAANQFIRAALKVTPNLPPGVRIVNLVHDEWNLLVTDENKFEVRDIVEIGFQEAFAELFGDRLVCKLEFRLGSNWANGEAFKSFGVN